MEGMAFSTPILPYIPPRFRYLGRDTATPSDPRIGIHQDIISIQDLDEGSKTPRMTVKVNGNGGLEGLSWCCRGNGFSRAWHQLPRGESWLT